MKRAPLTPIELASLTGDWNAIGRAPPSSPADVTSFCAQSVNREPILFILLLGFVLAAVML